MIYRIVPNEGTRRISKVISDILGAKLRFCTFQQRFRIENRTISKETACSLVINDRIGLLQTMEGALIREGALNRQNTVLQSIFPYQLEGRDVSKMRSREK